MVTDHPLHSLNKSTHLHTYMTAKKEGKEKVYNTLTDFLLFLTASLSHTLTPSLSLTAAAAPAPPPSESYRSRDRGHQHRCPNQKAGRAAAVSPRTSNIADLAPPAEARGHSRTPSRR
jgi:hypothetical protein